MAAETRPAWFAGTGRAAPELVADIEVWRAAHAVERGDTRPTGDRRGGLSEPRWQTHLDRRLASPATAAMDEWRPLLEQVSPLVLTDDFAPTLAARLSQLSSAGINVPGLLRAAGAQGPLPDDHAAAALWWRLSGHLTPAVVEAVDTDHHLATQWLPTFTERLGDTARELQDSPWWPALVTTIEHGLQRGWPFDQLLEETRGLGADDGRTDPCQAWVWRLSLLTDAHDLADEDRYDPADEPPDDLTYDWAPTQSAGRTSTRTDAVREPVDAEFVDLDDDQILHLEGMVRAGMGAPEPTDAQIRHQLERRDQITASPVPIGRLAGINELTTAYYQACLPNSWATPYLDQRLHADPATLEPLRLGYAPDSWTGLITHLRRIGVTDEEMLTAGVANTASTGRLIDRFRDRLVVPIVHGHQVLGFVARRNPEFGDEDGHGPKYLNTAATPLFARATSSTSPANWQVTPPPSWSKAHSTQSLSPWPETDTTSALPRSAPASPKPRSPNSTSTNATSSSPPTPTSPDKSPPSATTGYSPSTTSTPPTPCSPKAPTTPTSSQQATRPGLQTRSPTPDRSRSR